MLQTSIHHGSGAGLLECQQHCLPCRFPSTGNSSSGDFFMPGITLAEKGEKYFRGSSRFSINKTDQGQVDPARCLCPSWPLAPAGPRQPCSKTWLLCFSCFGLFWSLELLGLLCGLLCSNKLSNPLVLSQGPVGVRGIIPVYRQSWGGTNQQGKSYKAEGRCRHKNKRI